ncbi:MAG TPA: hypothetical protein VHY84_29025 [Bryobacteraceae bacterium]|jgi:hypothetical protein|nr:hypothetical protein [Bryobacteraceae bacterium]
MPDLYSAVKQSMGSKENLPSGIRTEGIVVFFLLLTAGAIGSAVTKTPAWVIAGG